MPISSSSFVDAMNDHWQSKLGNVSSPKLREMWGGMAMAFADAIAAQGAPDPKWRVLAPPTGTGKTEGLKVYSSMLAKANRANASNQQFGVLLVTRQIAQADDLADTINTMAGMDCAVAWHSKSRTSAAKARDKDVVAITHNAFVRALAQQTSGTGKWDQLLDWRGGTRSLVVIDEALDDLVEQFRVTAEEIRFLLGNITEDLRGKFPAPVAALEKMMSTFLEAEKMTEKSGASTAARFVWRSMADKGVEFPHAFAMSNLAVSLAEATRRRNVGQHSLEIEPRVQQLVNTLRGCEAILSGWAWYGRRGKEHTFNTARLAIPFDVIGPVILDATASQNMLWELMGTRAKLTATPKGIRSYSNVTLHVARTERVGKTATNELGHTRIPKLFESLEAALGPNTQVLVCLPKAVEHIAAGLEPRFKFEVVHWGDVDGKNQWSQFDAVAILSLPYRDDVWAINLFCALQGLPENAWMAEPKWRKYDNVREVMQHKQIAVSVIQAINRVQCRRVTDQFGRCAATDVFILLPLDQVGDRVLGALAEEMPGISTATWNCDLDALSAEPRKGSSHKALHILMGNKQNGLYPMTTIESELGINRETGRSLRRVLKNSDHPLTRKLHELGVTYLSDGKGRGASPRLAKIDGSL